MGNQTIYEDLRSAKDCKEKKKSENRKFCNPMLKTDWSANALWP